jgi:ATP-dependent helicase/nuclease subunit A
VVEQAVACVEAPAMAEVWRKPPFGEVWRERAFEVVIDQDWITGVFDRVIVKRDSAGRAVGAVVIDYKTDSVGTGDHEATAGRYAQQLDLYRKVVAILVGVQIQRISCWVVFTGVRKIVVVEPVISEE